MNPPPLSRCCGGGGGAPGGHAKSGSRRGVIAKEEVDDVGDAGGRGACGADAGGCCAPRRACGLALSARSAACEERFDQAPLLCAWLCAWLCALL